MSGKLIGVPQAFGRSRPARHLLTRQERRYASHGDKSRQSQLSASGWVEMGQLRGYSIAQPCCGVRLLIWGSHWMTETIIARCESRGLRMTEQRRTIAAVLEGSDDHPHVEELYARASAIDPNISLATVYRTVKLFEEAGILDRLEFGDGRARYEDADRDHHDHLIDIATGEVIEFCDPEIEALQEKIAQKLGFKLKGHRLELYGVRIPKI
jgi:Fur family transcriptional regulator, ferric uptake regulator